MATVEPNLSHKKNSKPEHVAKYPARYLTGGPISDWRLISHEHGNVTFQVRTGETPGGNDSKTEPYTLSGTEFVRRWSMHILPKGYTKTRRYGGYSNYHRNRYIDECKELLSSSATPEETETAYDGFLKAIEALPDRLAKHAAERQAAEESRSTCPKCGGRMNCVSAISRPSWSTVMSGPHRPKWYGYG